MNAIPNPVPIPDNRYPVIGRGQREHATLCDAAHESDRSKVPLCTGTGENEAQCAATVIDHFTSSFTWAQKNFSAIWLRGWWFLMTDSAITDAQSGGLTFVTGGGYTRADAAQGYWSLSHRNLYVGNTQPNTSEACPRMPLHPMPAPSIRGRSRALTIRSSASPQPTTSAFRTKPSTVASGSSTSTMALRLKTRTRLPMCTPQRLAR